MLGSLIEALAMKTKGYRVAIITKSTKQLVTVRKTMSPGDFLLSADFILPIYNSYHKLVSLIFRLNAFADTSIIMLNTD